MEASMRLFASLLIFVSSLFFGTPVFAQALPTFRDCSIASLSGSSTSMLVANPSRKYLFVMNTGTSNVGVNLAGGTAAIAGAGTVTLVPGASLELPKSGSTNLMPTGIVTVIGTAAQPVVCYEGR
jgi:hypothetical protein